MALITKRPKGTADVVPAQVYKWHTVEKLAAESAELYGFKEIRVHTFEDTGLFVRSVGETTDVVQKEMYTVTATGDSQFTLRPEGTAGVMRAMIENGILNETFPQKAYYIVSCFRHENVQAGRLREFHQFGCEMVGTAAPRADAEVISLARSVFDNVGIEGVELNINSIGCPACRSAYQKALKDYFTARKDCLCGDCHKRLERNPMRLLDCKVPECKEAGKDAPLIIDYLCEDCKAHFESLKKDLDLMGIKYKVDPLIVRGLDYYTRTVFEFIKDGLTVCGGGRYDGLREELGGPATPALGFGMGLERLISVMEKQGCEFAKPYQCDLYIASMGESAAERAMQMAAELRGIGYYAEHDLVGRGIKPQMKYANKLGAAYTVVIGDDEVASGELTLKNMSDSEQTKVSREELADVI